MIASVWGERSSRSEVEEVDERERKKVEGGVHHPKRSAVLSFRKLSDRSPLSLPFLRDDVDLARAYRAVRESSTSFSDRRKDYSFRYSELRTFRGCTAADFSDVVDDVVD